MRDSDEIIRSALLCNSCVFKAHGERLMLNWRLVSEELRFGLWLLRDGVAPIAAHHTSDGMTKEEAQSMIAWAQQDDGKRWIEEISIHDWGKH